MPDREMVLTWLEICGKSRDCSGCCPYGDGAGEDKMSRCREDLMADAFTLLKEQEPAWISVKDKLPKSIANRVVVHLEHKDYVGYIGFGHYEKYRGEELWYDLENNAPFTKRGYTVTHWMPLPEPPKESR